MRDAPYRAQSSVSELVKELRDEGMLLPGPGALAPTDEGLEYVRAIAPGREVDGTSDSTE